MVVTAGTVLVTLIVAVVALAAETTLAAADGVEAPADGVVCMEAVIHDDERADHEPTDARALAACTQERAAARCTVREAMARVPSLTPAHRHKHDLRSIARRAPAQCSPRGARCSARATASWLRTRARTATRVIRAAAHRPCHCHCQWLLGPVGFGYLHSCTTGCPDPRRRPRKEACP